MAWQSISYTEILLAQQPILDSSLKYILADDDPGKAKTSCDTYCRVLDEYLELSTLLDPILPSHTIQLCDALQHRLSLLMSGSDRTQQAVVNASRAIYSLSKVRGVKPFSTHLPHEVRHLRFLLPALHFCCERKTSLHWNVRHVLFVWASVAVRAPFPLVSIVIPATIEQAIGAARSALKEPNSVADVAALFLAYLLARRDAHAEREAVITSATEDIQSAESSEVSASSLALLAAVFKYAHRDDVIPFIPRILSVLHEITPVTTIQAHRVSKLSHRLALAFLPPRPASWRYSRVTPNLLPSLGAAVAGHEDTTPVNDHDDQYGTDEISEEDAARLGAVVDLLFESLHHPDAVVRYSAAKGVARLAARLPHAHASEVVEGILDIVRSDHGEARADAAAHGGCLAIAEFTRRGLLLPNDDQLGQALSAVRDAARFELRRTAGSVGANVRDAACYAVWAVARAYDHRDVESFAPLIVQAMIPVALLDREVNCRRAASAALQECVGRLSHHVFPDGISLITIADYFSLGDRNAAFVVVTPKVAALGDGTYVPCIIEELWSSKLIHWDGTIRALAAKALAELVQFDRKKTIVNEIIPEMVPMSTKRGDALTRHGAVLGLAELVVKVGPMGLKTFENEARKIPMVLNEKGYFHGRTGDDMRAASCLLIKNLSKHVSDIYKANEEGRFDAEDSMKILERFLSSGKEKMYAEATDAYEAMFEYVISQDKGWHMKVTRRVLNGLRESASTEYQRGFALSLGSCGLSALTPEVVRTLCSVLKTSKDAEVRRNSGLSLSKIPLPVIRDLLVFIIDSLRCGMRDYATDDRGDIGSWVREASMKSFAIIVERIFFDDSEDAVDMNIQSNTEAIMRGLEDILFECCGRIDRTRVVAGKALKEACGVLSDDKITHESQFVQGLRSVCCKLNEIFRFRHNNSTSHQNDEEENKEVEFESGDWSFPAMRQALAVPEVRSAIMRGFVASGGGTRSQFRAPREALVEFFCEMTEDDGSKAVELKRAIIPPIEQRDPRLMTPALTVIGALARHGALQGMDTETLIMIVREIRASWRGRLRDVRLILAGMSAVQELMTLSLSDDKEVGGSFTFGKGSVGRECLEALVVILGCAIPRLRNAAAETVYTGLIMCDIDGYGEGCSDGVVKVLDILLDTPWKLAEIKQVRSKRDEVCRLLNISVPVVVNKTTDDKVNCGKLVIVT